MPIGTDAEWGKAEWLLVEPAHESSKEGDAAKPSKSEAVANPPVDSATGFSQHRMTHLDSIWDSLKEEKELGYSGSVWDFIGEERPGSSSPSGTSSGTSLEDEVQTNNAVEDICTGSVLSSQIFSGPPAVAARTKCESAVVADARCHSPAVAERTKCEQPATSKRVKFEVGDRVT